MWEFLRQIGAGASPLLAALVAYLLGLRAYGLQREHELVRRRYLDEGLDAFAADVEHALIVFKNNWQHGLTILKHYREMDAGMRRELLDTGFMDLDMSQFRVRPNYRVATLVGDKVFWNVQQLLFAFVGGSTAFFREDLGGAIRHATSGGELKGSRDDMISTYVAECEKQLAVADRYHVLLAEVQAVTAEFEKKRYTLGTIHKFKDECAVRESVGRLREAFRDKLAKYEA
jgi:hypothetical protein